MFDSELKDFNAVKEITKEFLEESLKNHDAFTFNGILFDVQTINACVMVLNAVKEGTKLALIKDLNCETTGTIKRIWNCIK